MDKSNNKNNSAISLLISKDKWINKEESSKNLFLLGEKMALNSDIEIHNQYADILIVCNNIVADDFAKGFYQGLLKIYMSHKIKLSVNWWNTTNQSIDLAVNKKSYMQPHNNENTVIIVLGTGHDRKDELSSIANLMRSVSNKPKTTTVFFISPVMSPEIKNEVLNTFQSFDINTINVLEVNILPEGSHKTQIADEYINTLRARSESKDFIHLPQWTRDTEKD